MEDFLYSLALQNQRRQPDFLILNSKLKIMNIKNNGLNNVETRCIASLTNIYDPEKNIYNKKTKYEQ